ncbi:DUF3772 domain-containing protein [Aestuariivita boseongensis]|uniref:DUF3772 domain-containing protein n=1 Tax=Aestuariivita boseongensis TaxID=1470562 RepID=UPI0006833F55|nr:DUF3772 domain-containing protein [Aestuariivita boseongensis]
MRRTFRWLTFVFALLTASAVWAQGEAGQGVDFEQWQVLAQRAEGAIDAGRASDAAFEAVRAELVRSRQAFLEASRVNAERISTLQSQINALGPLPESGEEPAEIAARRAELNRQLQAARAPILAAEEAYNQADGLIREIDGILAERRADDLLARGPSPLNPILWPPAFERLTGAWGEVLGEFGRAWQGDATRQEFQDNLPLIGVLLGLGLVLIIKSRPWVLRLANYLRRFGGTGAGVWSFLLSLGRIVFPVIGIIFITEALFATGLVGLRGTRVLESLPIWGAVLLGLRWLCERLFSRNDDDALIPFSAERRTELRFYGTLLAVLYVVRDIHTTLMEIGNSSDVERQTLAFPVLVVAAIILFRLGQILVSGPKIADANESEPVTPTGFERFLKLFGQASIAVAVAAPVVAAVGYTHLAMAILYPTIQSLALFGLVVVLQRFFADLYGLISGKGAAGRDSLVAVLIGFLLIVVQLPFLALIWGMRPAELLEIWTLFNEGFALGETRISPSNFLAFVLIFVALYMLTRLFQGALKTSLLPKTKLDTGGQNAVVSGVGYLGIFLAALAAITGAGIDLSGLALLAGALSVGIGFGLQNIVQNFVSGIILLIERPIAEGDWIEVNGSMGYVRDISVRSTRIETFDRTDVIVPNADFVSGTVTNYTRGNTVGRVIVPVGVAYGTDTRKVEAILREIAEAHPMVLANPAPNIVFQGFGADSLDFEIRAILRDVNWVLSVKSDMNHEIAKRFVEEGIEIPYAQRDIWIRNPEALTGGGGHGGEES